jgi:hypothetical protein
LTTITGRRLECWESCNNRKKPLFFPESAITGLQQFTAQQADVNKQHRQHATNVVMSLKSKLANLSARFKRVLEVRSCKKLLV